MDPDNILNPGKMGLEEREAKPDIYDYFAFKPLLEHPEKHHSLGKAVDDEVLACIHCGFCRLGCPTFSVTQRESRNARGRNALAFYFMNGTIEPSRELAEAFYSCTTCQACTYFCPARIKVDEVVEGVRKKMYKAGMVPEPVLGVRENILKTGNVFASARAERISIYPPALKEKAKKGTLKSKAETLLFMGCVPSYLDMKMVPSLLKPLDAAGVDYTTLATEEGCCGFPLFLMGTDEFEVPCREDHGEDQGHPCPRARDPLRRLLQDLQEALPQDRGPGVGGVPLGSVSRKADKRGRIRFKEDKPVKVTYHDPCDLGRAFLIFDEPRNILKTIPGVEYVDMARTRLQARCCGGGGGVGANIPEMAVEMAAERVRDALAVGAEVIVSGCAACKDNLRKGAKAIPKDERGKIKVMDITEMVANAME